MKKIWILIAILLVIGLGIYFYNKRQAVAPVSTSFKPLASSSTAPTSSVSTNNKATTTPHTANTTPGGKLNTQNNHSQPDYSPGHFSSGDEADGGLNVQVVEVDYTDKGFSPEVVNINAGDYIFFKNTSDTNFYPVDSAYIGFGPTAAVAPGKQYKFQYGNSGTWIVQNKLNATQSVTVHVAK